MHAAGMRHLPEDNSEGSARMTPEWAALWTQMALGCQVATKGLSMEAELLEGTEMVDQEDTADQVDHQLEGLRKLQWLVGHCSHEN